jgi:hypothetical protein
MTQHVSISHLSSFIYYILLLKVLTLETLETDFFFLKEMFHFYFDNFWRDFY